jgi:low affinity Fe/Cu permease
MFARVARRTSVASGTSPAFIGACSIVVVWALLGKAFNYSDTWQLVINTGTTIITFLMVFLIQNAQNHDSRALHLKLDEIIRSLRIADNKFIDLENSSDEKLDEIHQHLEIQIKEVKHHRARRARGKHAHLSKK